MNTRQENQAIRQALKKEYPTFEISVRQDTGTAAGWKIISIKTDIIRETTRDGFYTQEYADKLNAIEKKAREIAHKNAEIGTYCADDMLGTNRDELLICVRGIEKK